MAVSEIATLRSFNRMVTERIGVLHAEYLGRGRSLGASRVLWEIGADGTDIKTLRSRLGLDSGYLSRLLGALEREGLIEITSDETDMRVRRLQLTRQGGWSVRSSIVGATTLPSLCSHRSIRRSADSSSKPSPSWIDF